MYFVSSSKLFGCEWKSFNLTGIDENIFRICEKNLLQQCVGRKNLDAEIYGTTFDRI